MIKILIKRIDERNSSTVLKEGICGVLIFKNRDAKLGHKSYKLSKRFPYIKVLLRLELRLSGSEPEVMTITP